MECPKCRHTQEHIIECESCGIIFDKYFSLLIKKKFNAAVQLYNEGKLQDSLNAFKELMEENIDKDKIVDEKCNLIISKINSDLANIENNKNDTGQSINESEENIKRDKSEILQLHPRYSLDFEEKNNKLKKTKTKVDPLAKEDPNVNSEPSSIDNPKKNHKILYIALSSIMAIVLAITFIGYSSHEAKIERDNKIKIERQKAEEFSGSVRVIILKLYEIMRKSSRVIDDTEKQWRRAVSEERDINDGIEKAQIEDKYDISTIETLSNEIKETIKFMDVPADKEQSFQRLKEIYLLFDQYATMATSPSGSLKTYSDQEIKLTIDLKSAITELQMMKF